VVRETEHLDSTEVRKLQEGEIVEQVAGRFTLKNGIVRIQIRHPSSPQFPMPIGWVTLDATACGGPKFLEPGPEPMSKGIRPPDGSKGKGKGKVKGKGGMMELWEEYDPAAGKGYGKGGGKMWGDPAAGGYPPAFAGAGGYPASPRPQAPVSANGFKNLTWTPGAAPTGAPATG